MADLASPEQDAVAAADVQVAPVVTLFEQYGAGAAAVGHLVAERLGVPFHDQAFGSEELEDGPEAALESRATLARVLGTLGGAYGGFGGPDVVTTQREKRDLVTENTRTVREYAKGGAVILGRNGAMILADRPRSLHVLLTGALADRIARAAATAQIPTEQAAKRQQLEDQVRAEMSKVLYGWDPLAPDRYDLVINTSRIPAEAAATAIVDAIEVRTP